MHTLSEAIQLMESNHYDQAIEIIEEYLKTASDDEKFTIAELYYQWGFLQRAEYLLEELYTLYPEENEVKMGLANIYIDLEKDEEAIELLNEIHPDDPTYVQSLLQLADLYESQGLYEVSEAKLIEAKQLLPNEPVIDFALGELFFSLGDYSRAIIYYERLIRHHETMNEVSIRARLAESLAGIGEYEKAVQYYDHLEEEDPDLVFKHGLAAFFANQTQKAIQLWEELVEYDKYYHTVYLYLAKAYDEEGYVKEAYETSLAGIKLDEFNKELYLLASKLARKLGEYEQSKTFVKKAVELDPEYKDAVLFLIQIYNENEQYDSIIDQIEKLKKLGIVDPVFKWELARAYVEMEQYKKARLTYKEAARDLQHDSDFLKEYAYFLVEEGKIERAINQFQKYLEFHPYDDEVKAFIERLTDEY